ncbi:MAG: hypothetical protein K0B37_08615 [Bacteroidales bacterium]|nr:hypothetical protein [Bacteroidales bacterium]
MEKTISEAKMALTIKGKTYKLVSYADSRPRVKQFARAYRKAGYRTIIRKATPSGFALYAEWLFVNQNNEIR